MEEDEVLLPPRDDAAEVAQNGPGPLQKPPQLEESDVANLFVSSEIGDHQFNAEMEDYPIFLNILDLQ